MTNIKKINIKHNFFGCIEYSEIEILEYIKLHEKSGQLVVNIEHYKETALQSKQWLRLHMICYFMLLLSIHKMPCNNNSHCSRSYLVLWIESSECYYTMSYINLSCSYSQVFKCVWIYIGKEKKRLVWFGSGCQCSRSYLVAGIENGLCNSDSGISKNPFGNGERYIIRVDKLWRVVVWLLMYDSLYSNT